MPPLLPDARRASRVIVLAALGTGLLPRQAPGRAVQQAVVLGALALGMPHGAADTELLRAASGGSRRREVGLSAAYAVVATGATLVVRRGGPAVERALLLASAAHFSEGELACWGPLPPRQQRARAALRLLAAALVTVAVPAAVGRANRLPAQVGLTGAAAVPARAGGDRTGLALLRGASTRRTVARPAALAAAACAALAVSGDLEAAADAALLGALAVLAPPSVGFAGYFGGWHALRHTARVVDALVADGRLPPPTSLPGAFGLLARRSAWAAGVGLVAAGALAAADREHASDNAFAAVLGLTVPHMTTVALQLSRRGR